jgi:phosphate transport system substrate-binding protein
LICFLITLSSLSSAKAEIVTVAGSGGMIPLLTVLATAYMKRNPHDTIKVNPNSLTQSGGILAAKTGAVDIGLSARPLEVRELSFNIDAYHIADVAADVAVHGNVPVWNLTSQQLCGIYSGKITNWLEVGGHNARIIVLTRPESDSTKEAFRKGIPCFGELLETPVALNMYKSNDMLAALVHTPDSIGLIDSIALERSHGKARPLKIDGKAPSPESGRWPVIKQYTLIVGKERSKATDRFIRFIRSPLGRAIIRKHGGIPIHFSYP